jgi:RNA polymerase-binding transcription factor DksA
VSGLAGSAFVHDGGLTARDMAELRRNLLLLRAKATGNVAFLTGDNLQPLRAEDEDVDSFDPDFALSVAGSAQDVVNEIDDALRRMDNGTYGICEETGRPIPKARLKAIPYARYCVEAQSLQEKARRAPTSWTPIEIPEQPEEEGASDPAAETDMPQ